MATFNLKPDRIRYNNSISTLDTTHCEKLLYFKKRKINLPNLKEEIIKMDNKLIEIKNELENNYDENKLQEKNLLKDKINKLKKEIYDIENNISEMEYYSKVDNILMDYYDIIDINEKNDNIYDTINNKENKKIDKLDKLNIESKKKKKKKKIPKKRGVYVNNNNNNIMDFFNKSKKKEDTVEKKKENNVKSEKKIKNRASLFKTYKLLINHNDNMLVRSRIKKCNNCNVEKTLIHSEGIYVCRICAEVEPVIIDSEKPNYKDPLPEKSGYPYKRINHFNEWLSQFQAKESTDIPDNVYDSVIKELQKMRINNYDKLTLSKTKAILKKLRLHQYYEHIPHIISKISGNQPPEIGRETEEILRYMFKEIQIPFENNCPKNRTNFLSYSYVLHKFCQLLELDDFIKCFPLLKSREKLRQQDKIWKKICLDLDWEYYPSI